MDVNSPRSLRRGTSRVRTRSIGQPTSGAELDCSPGDLATKSLRRAPRLQRETTDHEHHDRSANSRSLGSWKLLTIMVVSLLAILFLAEPLLDRAHRHGCKLAPDLRSCSIYVDIHNPHFTLLLEQEDRLLSVQYMAAESVILPLLFAYGLSAFKAIAHGVMSVDSRMGVQFLPLMSSFEERAKEATDGMRDGLNAVNALIESVVEFTDQAKLEVVSIPSTNFFSTLSGFPLSDKVLSGIFTNLSTAINDHTETVLEQSHGLLEQLQYTQDFMDSFLNGVKQGKPLPWWSWLLPKSRHTGLDRALTWQQRLQSYSDNLPNLQERTEGLAYYYHGISTAIRIFGDVADSLRQIRDDISYIQDAAPETMPFDRQSLDLIHRALKNSSRHLDTARLSSRKRQKGVYRAFEWALDYPL